MVTTLTQADLMTFLGWMFALYATGFAAGLLMGWFIKLGESI